MSLLTNIGGGSGGATPLSTDIKTGSYTIPNGQHALVKCLSASDSAFTVDSGSGPVIAEDLTHFFHNSITSANTSTSIVLPVGADLSFWKCNMHFTCPANLRLIVQWNDGTENSSNQFYPRILWKGSEQNEINVNEAHDAVPAGSSTLAYVTCKEWIQQNSGIIKVINGATFALATTHSTVMTAERIREGNMYEGIVPAGTILNGDRYSVTLYSN